MHWDAMILILSIDQGVNMTSIVVGVFFLCWFFIETISIFMNVAKQDEHNSITPYPTLMPLWHYVVRKNLF